MNRLPLAPPSGPLPNALAQPGRRWALVVAALASVLLHAAAVWWLLPHGAGRATAETPPAIEVELVDQAPETKGAPSPTPPTAPPPAPQAPPPDPAGALPPPPPPAPAQTAPPGPPVRSASVNLGGAEDDLQGLVVTGRDVVPPRPDATIRNKPPGYPADAVRRHAEGVVALRIHVAENGVPAWVDVTGSSGDPSLDRAAREAVALWRFQPARQAGAPVPFDYDMSIRFTIGGTPTR